MKDFQGSCGLHNEIEDYGTVETVAVEEAYQRISYYWGVVEEGQSFSLQKVEVP